MPDPDATTSSRWGPVRRGASALTVGLLFTVLIAWSAAVVECPRLMRVDRGLKFFCDPRTGEIWLCDGFAFTFSSPGADRARHCWVRIATLADMDSLPDPATMARLDEVLGSRLYLTDPAFWGHLRPGDHPHAPPPAIWPSCQTTGRYDGLFVECGWPLRCLGYHVKPHEPGGPTDDGMLAGGIRLPNRESLRSCRDTALWGVPLTPIWPGLAVNVGGFGLAWLAVIHGVPVAVRRWRQGRRAASGCCPACGYRRRNLTVARCPECGGVVV